jgi:hypothetical protein
MAYWSNTCYYADYSQLVGSRLQKMAQKARKISQRTALAILGKIEFLNYLLFPLLTKAKFLCIIIV